VTTLESMDGDVKFALGTKHPTTPSCTRSIGFGSGGVAVHFRYGNAPTPQRDGSLAWSAWGSPTSFQVAPMSESTLGGSALHLENNAGHLYLEVHDNNGQRMSVFETNTLTLRAASTDPAFGAAHPQEVADGALVLGGYYPYSLYLLRPDATTSRLVAPSGSGRVVGEYRVDRSAGDAIVWTDADDTTVDRSDYYLWTSPYASSPGALRPRKVAKIPDSAINRGSWFAVNKGLALFAVDKDRGVLVRLSDGKGWSIPTEPGHGLVKPVWVDDEYVWFNTESTHGTDGLLRIARTTLGAPTVPSGLPDAGP
jgi:hypothetical protein